MKKKDIFRPEAISAQFSVETGEIVMIRPVSFAVVTGVALFILAGIISISLFGTYTRRTTVSGELLPEKGLLKVFSQQSGIVTKKNVKEGQFVKKGDLLYEILDERKSDGKTYNQESISDRVNTRKRSFQIELVKTKKIQLNEIDSLRKKINSIQNELIKISSLIEGQKKRVILAENTFSRYQNLLEQNFISKQQTQQKEEDLLDQRNRFESLAREKLILQRDLESQQNEFAILETKHQNQISLIEREISSVEQEFVESEGKRKITITASETGYVTLVSAEVGQPISSNQPLLCIVPENEQLVAQLYLTSKSIGFIDVGNVVLLRYGAFPYQKFGQGKGKVVSVSKAALPKNDLLSMNNAQTNVSGEALYVVTVQLESQKMPTYGKMKSLQAGMSVEADIMLETRKLYEWVLDPIYTATGKFS